MTGGRRGQVYVGCIKAGSREPRLGQRIEGKRQPRLVGRCRIGVQNALVDGMVDERQRRLQKRFCSGFVLGFQRCTEFRI